MSKTNKQFRLSTEDISYIASISQKYNIDNTKALEKIIAEHRENSMTQELSNKIANDVIGIFEDKYKNTVTRIRLAATGADQNSLILLEMINSLLVSTKNNKYAYTSKIAKSDVWIESEKLVKARIAHYKQNKDSSKGVK